MSLLAPLYALGLLAITAPIVFHLIRRSPKGEVPFSSLMFLEPTPPRLTRRSRLDNLLLLLLRALALGLLAFAFARPFFRKAAQLDFGDVERRRVAVLVDTSASMRRGTLWPKAKALADEVIAGCRPADQVALFAFDSTTRPLLGFAESATLDPARRRAVARGQLDRLSPTWGGTNLGQALVDAVAAIEDVADASEKAGRMPRRVVLIGDLQQGSRLDALGDFEWPTDVELDLKPVADDGSNAGLHPLAEAADEGPAPPGAAGTAAAAAKAGPQRRVQVTNDPASRRETFSIAWVKDDGSEAPGPIEVYVPPGESRVVRVPRPPGTAAYRALRLKGDNHAFDNTLHVADERRDEATVFYVGNDAADDPEGLLYYLERVFHDTPRRTVKIRTMGPAAPVVWEPERSLPLVILTAETTADNARRLRAYAGGGGTLLEVITAPGRAATLAALADAPPRDLEEASVNRDVLLGEIAFDHPLFASLSGAQFNDFTKIHFWKYRKVPPEALGEARVLARFENGDPAVLEKPIGKGRLVVMASGWQPADSQLARSSKFVPLMASLLEGRDPRLAVATNASVGDRVPLLAKRGEAGDKGPAVHKPDGSVVSVSAANPYFTATDQPGVYTIDTDAGPRPFAVNLDPAESKTSPLQVETLEQFGCRLVNQSRAKVDREHVRQMHNAELENRQKLWRWLILAAIGVLIVETWLAGRIPRSRPARAEALTT